MKLGKAAALSITARSTGAVFLRAGHRQTGPSVASGRFAPEPDRAQPSRLVNEMR